MPPLPNGGRTPPACPRLRVAQNTYDLRRDRLSLDLAPASSGRHALHCGGSQSPPSASTRTSCEAAGGSRPPPHTQHRLSSRGLSGLGWVLDSLSHVLDRVFFQGQDIFQVIVPTETRWGGKERPAGDSSGAGPAPSEPATLTPCLRGRHCAPPPPLPQPLGHCPECRQQLIKNRTVE